jgi:hypothetical protein
VKDRFPIAQWPELFDAVWRRNALLNRIFANIAHRNLRFAFELARAKTLGDVLKLQAEYWQNLFSLLQGKEFREAFFPVSVASSHPASAESPGAESAKAESAKAESPRAESSWAESFRAESSWAESAFAFAKPSSVASPVAAAAEPKIAGAPVAPSQAKKQGSEPKRAAATRAAQTKTKSERPQVRPERHRAEPGGARKAAPRRPAPQQAVAPSGRSEIRFGRLDDNAVRFTGKEAWRLRNGTWRKVPAAKVAEEAVVLSKTRFDQLFPKVPKLPAAAFKRERD